jgi:hypothetical protein
VCDVFLRANILVLVHLARYQFDSDLPSIFLPSWIEYVLFVLEAGFWMKAAENSGYELKTKLKYLVWNRRKSAKFLMMLAYLCTGYLFQVKKLS